MGNGAAREQVDAFSLNPWNLFAKNIRNITLKSDTALMWLDTVVEASKLFMEIKLILYEHIEQSVMLASRSRCLMAQCNPFWLSASASLSVRGMGDRWVISKDLHV